MLPYSGSVRPVWCEGHIRLPLMGESCNPIIAVAACPWANRFSRNVERAVFWRLLLCRLRENRSFQVDRSVPLPCN